ncbi:MAG TPA: TauD/TfdA family dioxygenase [Ilumatobacteraceae bacterium]|nr:TauD/TfdA family dioxygenase [Ilumatobacteraceae bacterium]
MPPVLRSAESTDRVIRLVWDDGTTSTFHHVWLRDNCLHCRHATTGHRVVETSTIAGAAPAVVEIAEPGDLVVRWSDDHSSAYPAEWLRRHDYSNGVRRERFEPVLWDASGARDLSTADYPTLLTDPAVKLSLMCGLRDRGVAILHGVPCEPGTVARVAEQFGEVRTTGWGTVFDVRAEPDANSVAYTNLPLVTHTDEAYRDPAPTIQLQHFLRTDAEGGETTLVDGFKVAADLRAERPDLFDLLASVSLHFHFRDDSNEHEHDAPVIELGTAGDVRAVRYSNHSVQPFLLPADQMEAYYEAYTAFGRMRESDRYRVTIRLAAGDLYMVDNRRVLHGRTGFRSGGERHLQSCYIERDEFTSRLRVLARERRSAVR